MDNVIFGMIIDTFSSLRQDRDERVRDTNNICFICGIEKQIFDRASDEPDGFKMHVKVDHNMWNYLYFIFLLWEQDKDDDDGMEQYVRRAIAANEIVWFPSNKAVRLEQIVSPQEVMRKELQSCVDEMEVKVSAKFDEFEVEISSMINQLVESLKQSAPQKSTPEGIAAESDIEIEFNDDMTEITESSFMIENENALELSFVSISNLMLSTTTLLSIRCDILVDSTIVSSVNATLVDKNNTVVMEKAWVPVPKDAAFIEIAVVIGGGRNSKSPDTLVAKGKLLLDTFELDASKEGVSVTMDFTTGEGETFNAAVIVRSAAEEVALKNLEEP